jgi:glutathione S-transferase
MADADTLILHHYDASPFSEKVRLAFGGKGAAWGSVTIPVMMPKPDLMPLTGGYRRTPVLQVGADIYCDTQLILREVERRIPTPSLLPAGQRGLASMVSMWADRTFFQTTVPVIFGSEGFNVPEEFKRDREQLSGRPFDTEQLRALAPSMRDQWRGQAAWIEEALADGEGDFLTGSTPGLADISAYMNLWFLRHAQRPGYDSLMAPYDLARAWATRMQAIGHGHPEPVASSDALAIAAAADPSPRRGVDAQEPQGLREGNHVTIMADDYGRDPISGTLVFADAQEIAISREVHDLGEIVVHFPRVGYLVRRS